MPREHYFGTSNRYGKLGEEEVLDFLSRKLPDLKWIENVTLDKEYQEKDIDAILHFKNGKKYTIEIKTDSYADTGNIAFELWSSKEDQIPGCMMKCQADYLYYYFPDSGELFQFKMESYRDWVLKNTRNFRQVSVQNVSWGRVYNSINYLIPKIILKTAFKDWVMWNTKEQ